MLSLSKFGLSEDAEKTLFWVFKPEIFRLSFEDIFLGTLDTYTKQMNRPSAVLRGGCTVRSACSEPPNSHMG